MLCGVHPTSDQVGKEVSEIYDTGQDPKDSEYPFQKQPHFKKHGCY